MFDDPSDFYATPRCAFCGGDECYEFQGHSLHCQECLAVSEPNAVGDWRVVAEPDRLAVQTLIEDLRTQLADEPPRARRPLWEAAS